VSETPGKTKHYQTLFVDDELLLCDCPGLVFPSFVSTRGELIINGILPVDQMRDYVEPINLLAHHIPKNVLEMVYGVSFKKPIEGKDPQLTAEDICSCYSTFRGYMNHKGMPDVNRGARYILKDYVNGKLLYCYPPPKFTDTPQSYQDHHYEMDKEAKYLERLNKIKIQVFI
jgi:large subunit GTPase 1